MTLLLQALLLVALGAATPRPVVAHVAKTPALAKLAIAEDTFMSSTQLIKKFGYPVEFHEARSADGYLLTLHRIPGSPKPAHGVKQHGTPVLIGHGMASSDDQWVIRRDSLAFLLADNGYDIWLGNYRGSFYSQKHPKRSIKSHAFWDFSWHENGVLDQPAMVDYILAKTGRPALLMIGHSMSSTAQAVFLAERPEYAGKVLAGVYMAPPVYFRHPAGALELVRAGVRTYPAIKEAYSRRVMNDRTPGADQSFFQMCHPFTKTGRMRSLCRMFLDFAGGESHEPQDQSMLTLLLGHFPWGMSIRQVMHYMQGILSSEFRQYDFGARKNKKLYGSALPPLYNLTAIATPSYVYYSSTDNLVTPSDAVDFAGDMPGLKLLHKVKASKFNHIDYIVAPDTYDLLYRHILENLNKYV